MAVSKSSKPSQSAADRRAAQRESLRVQRQAELRRQRTVRTVVIAVITVVALVLAGLGGWALWKATRPDGPVAVPAGMEADQPYLQLGAPEDSGKPVLELHLDFMCPFCGQFDGMNADDLQTLVDDEDVTLHLVPRRLLDQQSTTGDYSTRAANALVCVYEDDPDNALAFSKLMFENQPAEGSAGLTNEEIFAFAEQAGASEAVQGCMDGRTYQDWVRRVADPYGAENGGGTPYVEIDGEPFEDWMTEGALYDAVIAAGGSPASDAGGASDAGEG